MSSNLDSWGCGRRPGRKFSLTQPCFADILPTFMRASFRRGAAAATEADTLCVGLFEDEGAPGELDQALSSRLAALVDSGEAKARLRRVAVLHPEGAIGPRRVLVVGLGKRAEFDAERARIAAAVALKRAGEASSRTLAWAVPENVDQAAIGGALVEGTMLAGYRFDRFKSGDGERDDAPETLEVISHDDVGAAVSDAQLVVECQNTMRDLQNLPANELTPTALAEHALDRAREIEGLQAEAFGRDRITELEMGGLLAVARGSHEEPRLIVLRYDGGDKGLLGIVGKAVTFDTGGISIKPSAKMQEMKMDMSGGAAAIEGTVAIARLGLPVKIVTVVPATENMPSGHAVKPGDIITISNGKTVEVNNTDAEGRLILADALSYAASEGAERIVDLATLTGAIITALGSTYAGMFSNDDDLCAALEEASGRTGELVWRMPLHPDYKELTRGKIADLVNVSEQRKASSAYAASFLEEFVDGRPWAHLDIAGVAWDQDNREYVGKGASGWGVRLLVDLARQAAAA
jgi:leucyl aminopeptidase